MLRPYYWYWPIVRALLFRIVVLGFETRLIRAAELMICRNELPLTF